jgi:hypothetical protein
MSERLDILQDDINTLIEVLQRLDMSNPDVDDLFMALFLAPCIQEYIDGL